MLCRTRCFNVFFTKNIALLVNENVHRCTYKKVRIPFAKSIQFHHQKFTTIQYTRAAGKKAVITKVLAFLSSEYHERKLLKDK